MIAVIVGIQITVLVLVVVSEGTTVGSDEAGVSLSLRNMRCVSDRVYLRSSFACRHQAVLVLRKKERKDHRQPCSDHLKPATKRHQ